MHATRYEVRMNWRTVFCILTGLSVASWCATSRAQVLIGSTGAGWQTWNLAKDASSNFIDLNSNGSPYWDVPLLTYNDSNGAYGVARAIIGRLAGLDGA